MINSDIVHVTNAPPGSVAENILQAKKERIWIESFRSCCGCKSLSDHLTLYRFVDGSEIVLDSSFAFPQPVFVAPV